MPLDLGALLCSCADAGYCLSSAGECLNKSGDPAVIGIDKDRKCIGTSSLASTVFLAGSINELKAGYCLSGGLIYIKGNGAQQDSFFFECSCMSLTDCFTISPSTTFLCLAIAEAKLSTGKCHSGIESRRHILTYLWIMRFSNLWLLLWNKVWTLWLRAL